MRDVNLYPAVAPASTFSAFVRAQSTEGQLVVQPRMGFGTPQKMREGLTRVRSARAVTVGTITLDSFTRLGDFAAAEKAVASGTELNGYPLLAHSLRTSSEVVAGILDDDFPIQVRHGTPCPQRIFAALHAMSLPVTEGGPVSYSLPYGRVPLADTIRAWSEGCRLLSLAPGAHLESFGGCMLGQLCPPSLLVALSVLEAMFMRDHGIASVSLSYSQQTNAQQDVEALRALRLLAAELLGGLDWHIVLYSFMGAFPASAIGARKLSQTSVEIAVTGGADRLIVKTQAEAHRIPTIAENITALEAAHSTACALRDRGVTADFSGQAGTTSVLAEARLLIQHTRRLAADVGECLLEAFRRGLLDVPFCLHPDNRNKSRPRLDSAGRLSWGSVGAMPVTASDEDAARCSSAELVRMLTYNAVKFDAYLYRGGGPEMTEIQTQAFLPDAVPDPVQVPAAAVMELTDDARAALLAQLPHQADPTRDLSSSLSVLYRSFAGLPYHIVRTIRDFGCDPKMPGLMLLRNLPVDPELPATPVDGLPSARKSTFVSECVTLGLAQLIGEPVGYTTEKNGQIIHDVVAVPSGERSQTNQSSVVFLSFHNDTTHDDSGFYHLTNPDFLVLVCLRDSPDGLGTTAYVDARWLTRVLDDQVLDALRQPQFKMNAPGTYCREHAGGADVWSNPVPLIEGSPEIPEIAIAANGVLPLTASAEIAWEALREACNRDGVAFRTVLRPGDALIINNRKGVHAREPFQADYAGADRWLQRCYVRRSLWNMRHRATSAHRVFF